MPPMMKTALCAGFFSLVLAGPAVADSKDQSRLDTAQQVAQQAGDAPLAVPPADSTGTVDTPDSGTVEAPDSGTDLTTPAPSEGDDPALDPEDMSLGEIPDIKTTELTADSARRAIDTYVMVKAKYDDTDLAQYNDLQSFVDQNPRGKEFEADIKAAGFASVDEWNLAITTLGFAYTGVIDDPTADIKQQVADIEADPKLAQDLKDRMTASLNAMIPSENNRKVVEEMLKDESYKSKLEQFSAEEE